MWYWNASVKYNRSCAIFIDADFWAVHSLGMDIIAHIRESGKTVAQVCREADVSRETFYATIKPGANPRLETIRAIARAAGLTPAQIKPELGE